MNKLARIAQLTRQPERARVCVLDPCAVSLTAYFKCGLLRSDPADIQLFNVFLCLCFAQFYVMSGHKNTNYFVIIRTTCQLEQGGLYLLCPGQLA